MNDLRQVVTPDAADRNAVFLISAAYSRRAFVEIGRFNKRDFPSQEAFRAHVEAMAEVHKQIIEQRMKEAA